MDIEEENYNIYIYIYIFQFYKYLHNEYITNNQEDFESHLKSYLIHT